MIDVHIVQNNKVICSKVHRFGVMPLAVTWISLYVESDDIELVDFLEESRVSERNSLSFFDIYSNGVKYSECYVVDTVNTSSLIEFNISAGAFTINVDIPPNVLQLIRVRKINDIIDI